jgi:hypothetical protein
VTGLSYALQVAAARLLRGALPLAPLLPLPLPLALASFVPFALDVPATSSFTFLGVRASEKAFVYLSGLQLLLAIGRPGLAAGGLCLLAGLLHRANFLGLRRLTVRLGAAFGGGGYGVAGSVAVLGAPTRAALAAARLPCLITPLPPPRPLPSTRRPSCRARSCARSRRRSGPSSPTARRPAPCSRCPAPRAARARSAAGPGRCRARGLAAAAAAARRRAPALSRRPRRWTPS